MGKRWLVPVGLATAALIAAGCGSSGTTSGSGGSGGSGGTAATSSNTVNTAKIGGATVLTNAKGFTLYWFVPDTSTKSNCNGTCATFWPPVKGPVQAGSGVTGTLATITRDDGSTQASWNGHPLYTYKGDTAAGQAKGNNINIDGGVWHEVTLSKGSAGGGGGSGGYGY